MKDYIVIDVMEHEIYRFSNEIEMGMALDGILDYRDRIEIPYKIVKYNFGRIISIRDI